MFNFIKGLFKYSPKEFSVTQFGKPLDPSLYTWDEKTRTFTTDEWWCVLDFFAMDRVTFKTGGGCVFKTGHNCTFDTGGDCIFKTDFDCVFKTDDVCVFYTGIDCVFEVGERSFVASSSFNGFQMNTLTPNKKLILLENGKLVDLLGHIPPEYDNNGLNGYNINWWLDENKTPTIQVGCQMHSLETWKKNYKKIAEENEFCEKLIPEYLEHLKTIEESFSQRETENV